MKKKKFKFFGFSIMELIVSFIIVAVLTGTMTPIIFKKSSKTKLKGANSIVTTCESTNASCAAFKEGTDIRCQLFKKRVENGQIIYTCALCKASYINNCTSKNSYFDEEDCKCKPCSDFDSKAGANCPNCCIRCNKEYCTGCNLGVGLPLFKRSSKMGCEICSAGTYSDNKDDGKEAQACKQCKEGYFCPKRTGDYSKNPCPIGYYCPIGTKSSTEHICPAGCACPKIKMGSLKSSGVSGLNCPKDENNNTYPCQAGYYCPEGSSSDKQNACPKNTYRSSKGGKTQSDCRSCETVLIGSVTLETASTSSSQCICPPGKYALNGKCINCPADTFKIGYGNELNLCVSCPSGSTTNGTLGAHLNTMCKCKKGYFGANGGPTCEPCVAGKYQDEAGKTNCKNCTAGHYCPTNGMITPTECSTGTYQDEIGKTGCKKCDFGYYQSSKGMTSCTKCYDNATTSSQGNTSIDACHCLSGYISNGRYSCCKKITSNCISGTTKVITDSYGCKAICVSNRNAGDSGGYGSLSGIQTLTAALTRLPERYPPYTIHYGPAEWRMDNNLPGVKRCWQGRTAGYYKGQSLLCTDGVTRYNVVEDYCDNTDGYDGCTRTLCTYEAAKSICNNLGSNWRLPTSSEAKRSMSKYIQSLKLCATSTTDGQKMVQGISWCGSNYSCPYSVGGVCYPFAIWTQSGSVLGPISINSMGYYDSDKNHPAGVRCVYSLK